jgi:hypothetical protein
MRARWERDGADGVVGRKELGGLTIHLDRPAGIERVVEDEQSISGGDGFDLDPFWTVRDDGSLSKMRHLG